jgi:hypothetical protein
MQTSLIQTKIMRAQASHHSWFVTSARPFLLWICSLGFLFSLVIKPLLQWIIPGMGSSATVIMTKLTLTMLGLAGLRTIEKPQGFAK